MTLLNEFLRDPKALIIASPWAELVASGEKTWEMRSQAIKHRGYFAVAEKGTGRLIAMANLRECNGPHSINYLIQHEHRHCGPREAIVAPGFKYWFSWELDSIHRFSNPVVYQPKSGAVSWVKLSVDVADKVVEEMEVSQLASDLSTTEEPLVSENQTIQRASTVFADKQRSRLSVASVLPAMPAVLQPATVASKLNDSRSRQLVPKAKDGTTFDRKTCLKNGIYQVGEKGNEVKFNDYLEALDFLKKMKTATWRRPNSNGNWGGVRAVEWVAVLE